MSQGSEDPPEDDLETLAAEYVLGLLTVAELPHVVALRAGSARFDAAVRRWELRLLPLAEAVAPVEPRPRVWAAIAGEIAPPRRPLWDSLGFWRGFGIALSAACAVLVGVILLRPAAPWPAAPGPAAPLPAATAMLESKDGVFVATAEGTAGGARLVISPAGVSIPAGKSAELWLIKPGSKPAALGLLQTARPVAVMLPVAIGDIAAAELAISIEPPGGSPTGQATGPIIAVARFLPL